MTVSMTVASPSAARCRGRRDHILWFVSQSVEMPPRIIDDGDPWHVIGQMVYGQILGHVTAGVVPTLNVYNNEIPIQKVDHTRMGF
jgi:hypothetical protein